MLSTVEVKYLKQALHFVIQSLQSLQRNRFPAKETFSILARRYLYL